MVITIVCDVLGQENNGSTVAAKNLIGYLKQKGHTVKILCSDADKAGEEGWYIVPRLDFFAFNRYVKKNGVTLAKPNKKVVRAAIRGSDIVHVMFPFSLGIASTKFAAKLGIPVTAGFHMLAENITSQLYLDNSKIASKLTYQWFHEFYKYCDAIHFPTEYLREMYEAMYGPTNGYVISNGVNDMFRPRETQRTDGYFRILTIGRFSREKAQSILIDAVRLSRYAEKIRLIFAGSGPLESMLKKEAEGLPVPAVFGFYRREELVDVINSADLYIHSAKIEAEGISCLEAMACGVVPIISDSPKCATKGYALTGQSLFEYGNASDLAQKIDWWIENPERRETYSRLYAENAAKKFDQTTCMREMESMMLQVLQARRGERHGKI